MRPKHFIKTLPTLFSLLIVAVAMVVVGGCSAPQDNTATGANSLAPLLPFYDADHDNRHDAIDNASQFYDDDIYIDYYTDTRPGGNNQTYGVVAIGAQDWMAENLNYRDPSWALNDDPDPITDFRSRSGSWCYGNNPDFCAKYGRLYTSAAAEEACPATDGWRLPDNTDWEALVDAVGGSATAGTVLRSDTDWDINEYSIIGTNDYYFSALPGGRRPTNGNFEMAGAGFRGYWWSATLLYQSFAYWSMDYSEENVDSGAAGWNDGLSVRCVRGGGNTSIKEPPRRVDGM